MSEVAFSAVRDPDAALLRVAGEVDEKSASTLGQAISQHSNEFTTDLIVDLTQVSYLPSAAVGVLATARRRARTEGGQIDLMAADGSIAQRVLAVCALPHRTT